MDNAQKIADLLPDIHFTLDLTSEAGEWLLRRLFSKAQGTGELPLPSSNVEQNIMWQAWRAQAGLPPDDGHHDAETWHTARL